MKLNLFAKPMLRFTIPIGIALILSLCIGCVNLTTLEEMGNSAITAFSDINIFTDAEELQFGQEYVAQHDRKVALYTDPVVTGYINALGQSLVRHSERSNLRYTFKVVNKKGVNAYAVPGGFIYIHLDLIRAVKNESELAAVLGHEIGHIVGRHSMKRLTQAYGIEILRQAIVDKDSGETKKLIADILAAGLLFRYSRDNEREADFYGVQNIYDAGIAPEGAATFFETMHALRRSTPSALEQLLSTHPMPMERVVNVRAQINRLPPKSGLRSDSSRFQRMKRRVR